MIETLNIAQICPNSQVLGPGKRFVLWMQGCPFNCKGCVAPDWIPLKTAELMPIDYVVERVTAIEGLEGLTFSGGEPMLQAGGLATLLRRVRKVRPDASAIAFSGFTLEQLKLRALREPEISDFLNQLDVLIDGLYREDLNDERGLRGSSNQRVHFLTGRYENVPYEFESRPRQVEVHLLRNEILMVGVPSVKSLETFEALVAQTGGRVTTVK
jgi:anaerobic ribonucleoside-triphosphate reductase activating protein